MNEPLIVLIIQYSWLYGLICLWLWYQIKRSHLKLNFLFGEIPNNFHWIKQLLIVIPILFFSFGSGQLLYYFISLINPDIVKNLASQTLLLTPQETSYPLTYNCLQLLFIIIFAPVIEELLFRGILLHRWAIKWGLVTSLIVSSLFFGVLHLNVFGLFNFGLIMALIYLKTHTLFIPIAIHSLNNFIAIIFELISSLFNERAIVNSSEKIEFTWRLGLLAMGISLPWLINFWQKNWPTPRQVLPYFANRNHS
ncbi:CPBP family intramembrane metalloprotease [Pleurocapsales cyanobacterium LEGE 06147]|nr:CPBP family intramembrane metalloprotease [Pleurocapsales cyanobacterium LEGE 06147]